MRAWRCPGVVAGPVPQPIGHNRPSERERCRRLGLEGVGWTAARTEVLLGESLHDSLARHGGCSSRGARRSRTRTNGDALLPIGPGDWLAGLRPGKLDLMHATIPTYHLYGIEAIPTDVLVGTGCVRVVERGSGRVLATQQACMQAGLAILGRRRSAPETMSTGWSPHPTRFYQFATDGMGQSWV
jgi:hypothetical protein